LAQKPAHAPHAHEAAHDRAERSEYGRRHGSVEHSYTLTLLAPAIVESAIVESVSVIGATAVVVVVPVVLRVAFLARRPPVFERECGCVPMHEPARPEGRAGSCCAVELVLDRHVSSLTFRARRS